MAPFRGWKPQKVNELPHLLKQCDLQSYAADVDAFIADCYSALDAYAPPVLA